MPENGRATMWESHELRPSTGHTIRWVCCLNFLERRTHVRQSKRRLEPLSFLRRTNRILWNEQEVPHDSSRKLFFTQRHVFCARSSLFAPRDSPAHSLIHCFRVLHPHTISVQTCVCVCVCVQRRKKVVFSLHYCHDSRLDLQECEAPVSPSPRLRHSLRATVAADSGISLCVTLMQTRLRYPYTAAFIPDLVIVFLCMTDNLFSLSTRVSASFRIPPVVAIPSNTVSFSRCCRG